MKKILNYLDNKVGRKIYGNDNNFLINLIGHHKRRSYNLNFDNKLFDEGFLLVGKCDQSLCEQLKNEIDRFAIKNHFNTNYTYKLPLNEKIINLSKTIFNSNKDLINELNIIANQKYFISDVSIYRNYPIVEDKPNKEFYSNFYHCDHYLKHMFKIFILLNDTLEDDGPLHIYNKNQTKKIIKNYYKDRNNYEKNIENKISPYKFIGSRGESLICLTTECLHRAGVPKPHKLRDMLVLNLFFCSNIDNPWKFDYCLSENFSKKNGKLNY